MTCSDGIKRLRFTGSAFEAFGDAECLRFLNFRWRQKWTDTWSPSKLNHVCSELHQGYCRRDKSVVYYGLLKNAPCTVTSPFMSRYWAELISETNIVLKNKGMQLLHKDITNSSKRDILVETPRILPARYQRFGEMSCLHLQVFIFIQTLSCIVFLRIKSASSYYSRKEVPAYF
jgi:hypothetical protein